jgi:hypothetical protein
MVHSVYLAVLDSEYGVWGMVHGVWCIVCAYLAVLFPHELANALEADGLDEAGQLHVHGV